MSNDSQAARVSEAYQNDQDAYYQYLRNRKGTELECPECGGAAEKAVVLDQLEVQCLEEGCTYWEVIEPAERDDPAD